MKRIFKVKGLTLFSSGAVKFICAVILYLTASDASAQISSDFDFSLGVNYAAAEQTLDFFEYRTGDADFVAKLRGNQLAAETSILLARTEKPPDDFRDQLIIARNNPGFESDVYGFFPAKNHIRELRQLIDEIKSKQLDRRIAATVASFFPSQAKISTRFSVYLVVIGNERAAAYERRVVWNNDTPAFVNDDEGEPVIVVNLARMITHQRAVKAQFIDLLSTTAHECFHAAFSILKKSLPESVKPKIPAEYLLELVQNEGCAYYLSLQVSLGGETPNMNWFRITSNSIETLNNVLAEMLSKNISNSRVQQLLMDANLSGSFEKNYGAAAGQRMAYEIDKHLGRPALNETLLKGGRGFILAYQQACIRDPSLPRIDQKIITILERPE
ncbi:MAG: hypothetical protein JXA06_10760 [Bacteroidetes bacterium]|nr:hypothetical protein [Bacteroidota bacterium]